MSKQEPTSIVHSLGTSTAAPPGDVTMRGQHRSTAGGGRKLLAVIALMIASFHLDAPAAAPAHQTTTRISQHYDIEPGDSLQAGTDESATGRAASATRCCTAVDRSLHLWQRQDVTFAVSLSKRHCHDTVGIPVESLVYTINNICTLLKMK